MTRDMTRTLRTQRPHGNLALMDRPTAAQQIRDLCNTISMAGMKLHPLLPALDDEPTKAEIVKALFEITKNVEVVKKQLLKLEKRDDSALL